jgi:ribosomal protein S18 acetylase RimI-like enzyme
MTTTAAMLGQRRPSSAMYLWVLEQNTAAQAFYLARGGVIAGRELRGPFPGSGSAVGLRVSWPKPSGQFRWVGDDRGTRPDTTRDDRVVVRPATFADLDGLLRLYGQLADDRPSALPAEPTLARQRFGEIARQPDRVLLVAEGQGSVLGTADLLIVANLTHAGESWAVVENVIVDRGARRRGVGRALMTEVVRRCDEAGCYKTQLLSHKHRHEAHAFYASLGFEPLAEGFRRYRG